MAPARSLEDRVAAIRARVGAVVREAEPDAAPEVGAVGVYEAEARVAAAFPVREVQHWEDHGERGWVCRETGEILSR